MYVNFIVKLWRKKMFVSCTSLDKNICRHVTVNMCIVYSRCERIATKNIIGGNHRPRWCVYKRFLDAYTGFNDTSFFSKPNYPNNRPSLRNGMDDGACLTDNRFHYYYHFFFFKCRAAVFYHSTLVLISNNTTNRVSAPTIIWR